MRVIPIILGAIAIIATALPLSRHQAWWIRVLDFPRLQIVFIAVIALVWHVAASGLADASDAIFAVLLALSLGYQAFMIHPYTRLVPPQTQWSRISRPDSTISLLFANVQENNRDADRLRTILGTVDADLVLLVETDEWWLSQVKDLFSGHPYQLLQPGGTSSRRVPLP